MGELTFAFLSACPFICLFLSVCLFTGFCRRGPKQDFAEGIAKRDFADVGKKCGVTELGVSLSGGGGEPLGPPRSAPGLSV